MSLYSQLSYYRTKPAFTQLLALGKGLARKYRRPLHSIGIVTSVRNALEFGGLEAEEQLYQKPDFLHLHTRGAVPDFPPASYWSESSEPGHHKLFDIHAGGCWEENIIPQELDGRPFRRDLMDDDSQVDEEFVGRYCLKSRRSAKRTFQDVQVVTFSPLEWAIAETLAPELLSFDSTDSVFTHAESQDGVV
ncbi:hypothetical protein JAAARDRAFT_599364 [Jaapia argillacea MUCL 33604]|uniref:Uncharacterized protein n=1 Tax=Jaapia argillacea MUCL 33604 TaxID=933084 RepID=A0A067PZS8_9AGAM|nr:hypothetical protein JAAARDRAFT_599364 [Jaapia argillacea MUCL 33604]